MYNYKIFVLYTFSAPSDHLLVSNRSYAYASLDKFKEALLDAERAVQLRPDWAKVIRRKLIDYLFEMRCTVIY